MKDALQRLKSSKNQVLKCKSCFFKYLRDIFKIRKFSKYEFFFHIFLPHIKHRVGAPRPAKHNIGFYIWALDQILAFLLELLIKCMTLYLSYHQLRPELFVRIIVFTIYTTVTCSDFHSVSLWMPAHWHNLFNIKLS